MGYAQAPWTFKGRALYQLQLVKADEARKHVPPELKLVELFGYTLGGVYLARYEDSPAGTFDECVVMAGLVWNPPTSCAWAARVFVNNKEARNHGVHSVGLPSRLAAFNCLSHSSSTSKNAWWQRPAANSSSSRSSRGCNKEVVELRNVQPGAKGLPSRPVALFELPAMPVAAGGFMGPRMRLSLPSFSGGTREYPGLLQYSCDLQTSIMPVAPINVLLPGTNTAQQHHQQQQQGQQQLGQKQQQQQHPEVLDLLLNGKPLVCLAFSDMVMHVEEPKKLHLPAAEPTPLPAAASAWGQPQQQFLPAFAAMLPGSSSSSSSK